MDVSVALEIGMGVFGFFFLRNGDPRELNSFPTRRSSDLGSCPPVWGGKKKFCPPPPPQLQFPYTYHVKGGQFGGGAKDTPRAWGWGGGGEGEIFFSVFLIFWG